MAILNIHRKCFKLGFKILALAAFITFLFIMLINRPKYYESIIYEQYSIPINNISSRGTKIVARHNWRGLNDNEKKQLSVLGRVLFLGEEPPQVENPKKYQILVWKYGPTIENRHMKNFGNKKIDPFEYCPVNNCEITYADQALKSADIVIFHLHRMKAGELPKRASYDQIWAFLTDESPYHTFISKNKLANYNGVFNWSMTYRMDSDIPVPYGRTISRKTPPTEPLTFTKRRDVLVAILGSNCGGTNKRWDYVKELQKHIQVDVYGKCGTLKTCPGHFRQNCPDIENYLFYLAFENSNCDEYITEKLWWNAYEKNSIPIVMGASSNSYKKLLPPNSYLNVEDYAKPKDLATYIHYLNSTGKYLDYYKWKYDYQVLNEHGYFQSKSYHYCRVCEALNYNEKNKKVYTNLTQFWSVNRDCHPAWNA